MHGRAQCLVHVLDRRKVEARPSGADNDRRDNHVQPIKTTGGEKARNRLGSALDQYAAQSALGKRRKNILWRDAPVRRRKPNDFDLGGKLRLRVIGGHHQAANAIAREHPGACRQPPAGIEHDARRIWARDAPHGKLGIVGKRRAHSDDYRIDHGPQPVQMRQSRRTVDVVGMAAVRRHASVERLADLSDHEDFIDGAAAQRFK